MFSCTTFNPTYAEQPSLAPEAEELSELPSETELEAQEEGDRELSSNDDFNEAIAQIPNEELLALFDNFPSDELPDNNERLQRITSLQALTNPTRPISQIRHALWFEWYKRIKESLGALTNLLPEESREAIAEFTNSIANERQPVSIIY